MFKKLSEYDYRRVEALNSSGIKDILKSPMHYKAFHIDRLARSESAAMRFGTLVHKVLLEPGMKNRIRVLPEVNLRTKVGKETKLAFEMDSDPDDVILTQDECDAILCMYDSLYKHPKAKGIIEGSKPEMTGLFNYHGVSCKMKCDLVRDDGIVIDLKTTPDASPDSFMRSIGSFNYHIQAAFYMAGVEAIIGRMTAFYFIALEKEPPYACAIYKADYKLLEEGFNAAHKGIEIYKRCKEKNEWPGYSRDIEEIGLPMWKMTL